MLLQDRWHIAADFDATLGVRIDDYGHFGTSTNPRASLVWQASHDTTLKFLYGRAFRAPSFVERYIINNPVILGQPTLKPETIDSFDISLIKRINFSTRLQVNLFRSQLTDFVETAQNNATQLIFINGEKRDNYGLEIEYEREFQFDGKLVANYAHQKVESDATGASLGKYPHNNGSVRFTHGFENQWRYSIIWNWVSSRARAPGDFREKLEGYHTADITLSRMLNNESSLSLLIKNVANADLREPSTLGIFLPNDLPTGKRLALLELKLHDF